MELSNPNVFLFIQVFHLVSNSRRMLPGSLEPVASTLIVVVVTRNSIHYTFPAALCQNATVSSNWKFDAFHQGCQGNPFVANAAMQLIGFSVWISASVKGLGSTPADSAAKQHSSMYALLHAAVRQQTVSNIYQFFFCDYNPPALTVNRWEWKAAISSPDVPHSLMIGKVLYTRLRCGCGERL